MIDYFGFALGRLAFHVSMVAGSHPRTSPIMASGSGSRYLPSVSGLTPIRSATWARDRYCFTVPPVGGPANPARQVERLGAALSGPEGRVATLAASAAECRSVARREVVAGVRLGSRLDSFGGEAHADFPTVAGEVGAGDGKDERAGHSTHPLRGCDPRLAGGSASPVPRTIHARRVFATTSEVKDRRSAA